MTRILTEKQWQLLADAERPLYPHDNVGAHAFTSIMCRDDSEPLAELWEQAREYVECCATGTDDEIDVETAARVAAAQAVLVFGTDGFMIQPEQIAERETFRAQASYDVALGNFLTEHAPSTGDVYWTIKSEDPAAGVWEIALSVDGADSGLWRITETTAEQIADDGGFWVAKLPADIQAEIAAQADDAGERPARHDGETETYLDRLAPNRLTIAEAFEQAEQEHREHKLEAPACSRCGNAPATTHQEWNNGGSSVSATDRCDRCAQDLRDYAALPNISANILIDRPLEPAQEEATDRG